MNKRPVVYILASKRNGTLYIGVTSDLTKRVWEHKNDTVEAFTYGHQIWLGKGEDEGDSLRLDQKYSILLNGKHILIKMRIADG